MRLSVYRGTAILGLAVGIGCGDSTGVQPADLEGTWDITVLELTQVGGSATVDLIADLGATANIVIQSDGAFQLTTTIGGSTDSDSGTLTVSGNQIDMDFVGDPASGTISRNGDTVTIELDTGVEFDFDDDGTDDPATARIVMARFTL